MRKLWQAERDPNRSSLGLPHYPQLCHCCRLFAQLKKTAMHSYSLAVDVSPIARYDPPCGHTLSQACSLPWVSVTFTLSLSLRSNAMPQMPSTMSLSSHETPSHTPPFRKNPVRIMRPLRSGRGEIFFSNGINRFLSPGSIQYSYLKKANYNRETNATNATNYTPARAGAICCLICCPKIIRMIRYLGETSHNTFCLKIIYMLLNLENHSIRNAVYFCAQFI